MRKSPRISGFPINRTRSPAHRMTARGGPHAQPAKAKVSMSLQGKRILLGVTGGIAAYKAAALLRLLVKAVSD